MGLFKELLQALPQINMAHQIDAYECFYIGYMPALERPLFNALQQ